MRTEDSKERFKQFFDAERELEHHAHEIPQAVKVMLKSRVANS